MNPAKEVQIRKLLALTGVEQSMDKALKRVLGEYRTRSHPVSEEVSIRLELESSPGELLDRLIPLYDKHYTLDDLKALNAFYGSPLGRRMIAANALIQSESFLVTQDWAREKEIRIREEMKGDKGMFPGVPPPVIQGVPPAPASIPPPDKI